MDSIVLLKQVPDTTNIPADAWNHETGTLKRSMLDNVLNPFDLHALTCACRLRDSGGGRVVCLTMGIRSAADILIEAMSRGADEGILLTDPVFAGADTSATAAALALAIQKIEREIFGSKRDYLIIAGMQSVDGDTAQVPGQVSESLGIDLVAYICGIDYARPGVFKRITGSGVQTVQIGQLPAVVTLTDCTRPLYQSFARARSIRAKRDSLRIWNAQDVGADPAKVGGKGSWTQVVRIFSPVEEGRNCRFASSPSEFVELIAKAIEARSVEKRTDETSNLESGPAEYNGHVLVYAELNEGKLAPVVYELLDEARRLADILGEKVGAVLATCSTGDIPKELIQYGADLVYCVTDPSLDGNDNMALCSGVADIVRTTQPQIMLFGATPHGRQLAPRVAYATASGLTADCTHLSIGNHAGKHGILLQTRPALGGNIMATIISKSCRTQMATVRPGVLPSALRDPHRTGSVVQHKCQIRSGSVRVIASDSPLPKSDIATADLIVSGGAGLHSQGNFDKLLRPLASAMGEHFALKAAVGASRRAVEHSYAGRNMQVGQTGQTVSPTLYVAVGISGAVQHISAIQRSKVIAAINPDPRAAVFKSADVGFIGRAEVVIPRIFEDLRTKSDGK